jgi:hypothetical protein
MPENLLQEIQREAISSSTPLSDVLRKCLLLAHRIELDELKDWVTHELNGYPKEIPVPDYRRDAQPIVFADYFGPMLRANEQQVPYSHISDELKPWLPIEIREGIASVVSLQKAVDAGEVAFSCPPETHRLVTSHITGTQIVRIWRNIDSSFIKGIAETVRNRVLSFTLELESHAPSSGDPISTLKAMPNEIRNQFNTTIMGGVSNLNQGGNNVTQSVTINQGDLEAVARKLSELGFSVAEADEFAQILSKEKPKPDGSLGEKIKEAIVKASAKAGSGAIKISQSALGSILATISKQYLGIDG